MIIEPKSVFTITQNGVIFSVGQSTGQYEKRIVCLKFRAVLRTQKITFKEQAKKNGAKYSKGRRL